MITVTNVICEDFYSFTVKDWQGNDVQLEKYRGKVKDFMRKNNDDLLFYFRFHWLLM